MESNGYNSITALVGNTDIYLIDQIMKARFEKNDKILDAGCGEGRNMYWFLQTGILIYGIDSCEVEILNLKSQHPHLPSGQFQVGLIEKLPFPDQFFDHVISSAVLHFATSFTHFKKMIAEMHRVLKPNGILFIRMTSDIGIEDKVELISNGNYNIPDGSIRFLLTRSLLKEIVREFNFSFAEPIKTVNVDDQRSMSTLILQKK